MRNTLASLLLTATIGLAACGGGGSSGGGGGSIPQPMPTIAPTTAPSAQGNLPLQEAVGSSMAWVNPANHKTLYFLDVDTAAGGTCTAGCLGIWPVFAPTTGSTGAGSLTIITRSDGTGQQWSYQGHPLYNYAGDSGPDQANGDNFPDFGGHWHVARPNASATPAPGSSSPPCTGPYC
ncbi:MAG: COG4315 family predicted lipoprotein [Vulcanimicrobiaceae bacterium]